MFAGALTLYRSDYRALYAKKGIESERRRALLAVPRLLVNPSLQTVLVLRLANASPRATWALWRLLFLRVLGAGDWTGPFVAGPGLELPHPTGVVIGPGVTLGAGVMLTHNVSIGADAKGRGPTIGDRVYIYPGAVIIGGLHIGEESIVGANSFVSRDVPARSVVKRGEVEPMRESSFSQAVGAAR